MDDRYKMGDDFSSGHCTVFQVIIA